MQRLFSRKSLLPLLGLAGALLVTPAISASVSAGNSGGANTVYISSGPIRGFVKEGAREFLGLPYAAPPVGDLRWRPPQEPKKWRSVRDATKFGAACAQSLRLPAFSYPSNTEDCLYLNVYTPKEVRKKLPVMVWLPGGGHTTGSADVYDGATLATTQNVIVVTLNYRLNAFGWLVHPALDGKGKTTNYGLMDQQFALRWVKRNISSLGGDPNKVTVFGQSAGGIGTLYQLISPKSKGLFDRAIVESGAVFWRKFPTLAAAEETGKNFAIAIGCPDQTAACMRKASVETILAAAGKFPLNTAVLDGNTITMFWKEAFETGHFNRVPILDGVARDEYRWFLGANEFNSGHIITAAEYPTQLATTFGADAVPSILKKYPLSEFNSPSEALAAAIGDGNFVICGSRNLNLATSRYVPTYGYEFADRNAPQYYPKVSFPYGATHTSELQFLFKDFKGAVTTDVPRLTPAEQKLSKQMLSYWGNFATYGNPNARGTPYWPLFDKKNELTMILNTNPPPSPTEHFAKRHNCHFWDKYNLSLYSKTGS